MKVIGYTLGALALLLSLSAAYIQMRGIPTYPVQAPKLHIVSDSIRVAEGKRLVGMTCAQCHRSGDGTLSGRAFPGEAALGQSYFASNITQHPEAGIGHYTDGELAYLLRTGIKRTGAFAPPWMPRFNHLSDDDMAAIIAYLRSGDEAVQPSPVVQPAFEPSFLTKALTNLVIKPLPYSAQPIATPSATDQVALGRYLVVGRYECYSCHSASFQSVDLLEPEKTPGYLGGGNPVSNWEGHTVHSANLTPDRETGLGTWTDTQFIEALRFGKHPAGRTLRQPMMPYAAMSDAEAVAIWAYLQAVPAVNHAVDRSLQH